MRSTLISEARKAAAEAQAAAVKKSRLKRVTENVQWRLSYLADHPCVDCGETDPVVLEFDHVRGPKIGNVSHLIYAGRILEVIEWEVGKCEVRCSNCHKRVTDKRRVETRNSPKKEKHLSGKWFSLGDRL